MGISEQLIKLPYCENPLTGTWGEVYFIEDGRFKPYKKGLYFRVYISDKAAYKEACEMLWNTLGLPAHWEGDSKKGKWVNWYSDTKWAKSAYQAIYLGDKRLVKQLLLQHILAEEFTF
jgi:hypothetical protein